MPYMGWLCGSLRPWPGRVVDGMSWLQIIICIADVVGM